MWHGGPFPGQEKIAWLSGQLQRLNHPQLLTKVDSTSRYVQLSVAMLELDSIKWDTMPVPDENLEKVTALEQRCDGMRLCLRGFG